MFTSLARSKVCTLERCGCDFVCTLEGLNVQTLLLLFIVALYCCSFRCFVPGIERRCALLILRFGARMLFSGGNGPAARADAEEREVVQVGFEAVGLQQPDAQRLQKVILHLYAGIAML